MTIVPPVTFQLDQARPLSLPRHASDEALWNSLSHRIVRDPGALSEHARRISLCRRASMSRYAAGALADLLHVLDGHGQAFAMRLFASASARLGERERRLLERRLQEGRLPENASDRALLASLPGRRLPVFRPAGLPDREASTPGSMVIGGRP